MNKIIFTYNCNKDVNNYFDSIYRQRWLKHGRQDMNLWITKFLFPEELRMIKELGNEKTAKKNVKLILQKNIQKNRYEFSYIKDSLERSWHRKEKCFFMLLEQFYDKPIFFTHITAYFTTLPICPYSLKEHWFMVSYRFSLEEQIKTICHEIMHFMFLYHYGESVLQELKSKEKLEILKEALTVFLNTDFREIISLPDRGYPQEKELREFLLEKRKTMVSFETLLAEGVRFLKNQTYETNV